MKITGLVLLLLCLLQAKAQQPQVVLPIGHSAFVHSADVSIDGKHVVTGASDGMAKIWDVWGHLLFTLNCDEANTEVYAKFSPDGKQILTRSLNGVQLWNAATGTGIKINDTYNPLVAVFSPSGEYFLVMNDRFGKFDLTFFTKQGKYLKQPFHDNKEIIAVKFHPSDSLVVVAEIDQSVYVINIHTGLIEHSWEANTGKITAMDISPDGKSIAIATEEKNVAVFNMATGIQQFSLPAFEYTPRQVLFADEGSKLITVPEYDSVMVWDISTAKPVKYLTAGDGTVTLNKNATAFITQNNWEVKVWDIRTGNIITTLDIESNTGPIYSMGSVNLLSAAFSPNDKIIVTASADQTAKLWDFPTGEMISSLQNNVPQLSGYATDKTRNRHYAAYTDGSIKVWDLLTGKLVQNIKAHDKWVIDLLLSDDGRKLISASRDATAKVWDALTGKLITTVSSDPYFPHIAIANNGKNLVTTVEKRAFYWNAQNGKLLREFPKHQDHIASANISPDGNVLVTVTGSDSLTYMWNVSDGKLVSKFRNAASYWDPVISSDGTKLAMFTNNSLVTIRDMKTGQPVRKILLKGDNTFLRALEFTRDGKKLLIGTEFDGFHLADVTTGRIIFTAADDEHIRSIHLSNNDSLIVLTTTNRSVLLFNTFSGSQLATYKNLDEGLRQADILQNGNFITVNDEGYKQYASGGRLLYHSVPLGTSDFLCRSFSGYYYASPGSANLLHYKKDQKIISFQQLDLKYNRPDVVLADIGFADTTLIKSYARAYHKRISRLGLDSNTINTDVSLPVAEIIGATDIAFTRKEKELPLHIRCSDMYGLKTFYIWINDVPLYGAAGLNLSTGTRLLDTTINIRLSAGRNYIETSVTNSANAESYRQPLVVQYLPETPVESKTYFIGIGINKYHQSKYNLQWSVKDIRDLSVQLKAKLGAASIFVDTLFDEAVTLQNIMQLKNKLLSATEQDKVVIAFSGHGLLSKEFDYFLSTYHVDFENPAVGGLPYQMLEGLLDGILPRNKLMLIDACHSGEVDKTELATMGTMADSLKLLKGFTIVSYKKEQSLGLKNSFELMQQLFTNVFRSTGTTVISAAAGTQFALERGDLQNGVFTFSILEAMRNHPHITINELRTIVTERVQEITNGMQKPTSRAQNYRVNWQLW